MNPMEKKYAKYAKATHFRTISEIWEQDWRSENSANSQMTPVHSQISETANLGKRYSQTRIVLILLRTVWDYSQNH